MNELNGDLALLFLNTHVGPLPQVEQPGGNKTVTHVAKGDGTERAHLAVAYFPRCVLAGNRDGIQNAVIRDRRAVRATVGQQNERRRIAMEPWTGA